MSSWENKVCDNTISKFCERSWSGVAVWKWLANDDTCGICRSPLQFGVPARVTYGKERSPLQKGYTTLTGLPLMDAVLIANLLGMTAPWFV